MQRHQTDGRPAATASHECIECGHSSLETARLETVDLQPFRVSTVGDFVAVNLLNFYSVFHGNDLGG
jgi:hypothetical protein